MYQLLVDTLKSKRNIKLLVKMPNLRNILNEIKWTKDLGKVEIWYIHRGAPNNTKILNGNNVVNINKSSIDTVSSTIPYHRIFKIIYDGKVIFKR